ncbi:MAG: 3-hydroxyacyl-CoA dehydrogenase, partial [Rhodospirillaceae bacterium]|nr:3-hydroxyacyl-CoA dehydrogenase [Rhodospirillaceae bacterium]
DQALVEFGLAMGPFAVSDLAGLEIGWATRKRQAATRPSEERYVAIADRICEREWYGRKTGQGFYVYPESGKPYANPEVDVIIQEERQKAGVTPREFSNDEIVARFTTAMISEALRVLEEGIALRPIDIDATFLFGYGFPRFRGGPMHYANTVGVPNLIQSIETWSIEDAHFWKVPDLLSQLNKDSADIASLN